MKKILEASHFTLSQSKKLLLNIPDPVLCDKSISPYYSSIGSHVRHILDFYKCIFDGIKIGVVDLTKRERNLKVETDCDCASDYLNDILSQIHNFDFKSRTQIIVVDDLGGGKMEIEYTLESLFSQANSHTIHHYAIINYILDRLGIEINDSHFGYNPTSPKLELSKD